MVFSKNTYLLINIYVVPIKVIPVRYNTLVPALFPIIEALLIIILRYSLEFFQRCSFYVLNRWKSMSFHGFLKFWEKKKVTGRQIRWIWRLRHDCGVGFGQKISHQQRWMSRCIIVMQNPRIVFPKFRTFFAYCLSQTAHNFKVILLIDRTTLW